MRRTLRWRSLKGVYGLLLRSALRAGGEAAGSLQPALIASRCDGLHIDVDFQNN